MEIKMKVGLIGLGKMGQVIGYRLKQKEIEVIGFDINNEAKQEAQKIGISIAANLQEIAEQSEIIWLMLPAGKIIDNVIQELLSNLKTDSIIIDGGNSNFIDSIRRYEYLKNHNINFLDCGVSGGIHTKDIGCSLMIGGDKEIFERVENIFKAIAMSNGYDYFGQSGTGHYIKMVHNGIEYALLESYAEGFNLLKNGHYKTLDLEKISNVWLHGAVIRSWILELCQNIFKTDQEFKNISGKIGGGQTGQWTVEEAGKQNVTVPLIEKSLEIRKWSQQTSGNYTTKLIALLRNQFGGHEVEKLD